jgi:hypothetical protein
VRRSAPIAALAGLAAARVTMSYYYVQGTEAPGYWIGSGSGQIQPVGTVDRDGLTRALEGKDPATGRELVAPHARRVPGFDVTCGTQPRPSAR